MSDEREVRFWVTRDEALLLTGALAAVVDHGGTDVTVDLCHRVLAAWKAAAFDGDIVSAQDEMYESLQRRFDRVLAQNAKLAHRVSGLELAIDQHRALACEEGRPPLPCDLFMWSALDAD